MTSIQLPAHSYRSRAPRAGVQRLVNCYPRQGEQKGAVHIFGSPGISAFGTAGDGPQRGAIIFQERLHVLSGPNLYRIAQNGSATFLGSIPGTGDAPMAENGSELVILSGGQGYVYDGSIQAITDPDFRDASDCVFSDNFILFVEQSSGRFFSSDLLNAESYDSLNFATAESNPDELVGIEADHGQVFLAGRRSCEIWENRGGSGFPFARTFNGVIEIGCGAGKSISKGDNVLFFIDNTRIARMLEGVKPVRISQHGVEQAWANYSTIEDAEGQIYTLDGHLCWVLNFPTAEATWVYDLTTQEWYELESYGSTMWRVKWIQHCYGKILCGDRESGLIGEIDPDVFSEWGDPIVASWTYPAIYGEGRQAAHHRLQTILETGVGLQSGQGSDPRIMLEISDDGGRTFDHAPTRSMGAIGKYRTQVVWDRLGSSDDRVYRQSISDPVRRAILDTQLEVTGGRL
jgi:hypothetical protein